MLCDSLVRAGYVVRAALRREVATTVTAPEVAIVGDIGSTTEWGNALHDVQFVIHTAARAHVLNDSPSAEQQYLETNAEGTRNLASAAARAGVRRFIFLSSVKVNGEDSGSRPYRVDDPPRPLDAYGRSKALAEQLLYEIGAKSSMEIVCVRSPLVYGPDVRANFLKLLNCVYAERLLPLGSVRNTRSLVSLWNLCDFLVRVLEHQVAANRTWMVSDAHDVSTPELIRMLADAMGKRTRLASVPVFALYMAGSMLLAKAQVKRLCGSLSVDITETCAELDWFPPVTMQDGIGRTVDWYLRKVCGA
jgi:nucleoside-diphosphate-sugar epimerase